MKSTHPVLPDDDTIQKEVADGTFTTFRSLLRKGMGSRTIGTFSEQTGVSRSSISKMLNLRTISRPSQKTLEALAGQMFSVSYFDLCQSCGYSPEDIHDVAAKVQSSFQQADEELRGGIYASVKELLDAVTMLHIFVDGSFRKLHIEPADLPYTIGEDKDGYFFSWEYGDYACKTFFILGTSKTAQNHVVLNMLECDHDLLPASVMRFLSDEKDYDLSTNTIIEKRSYASKSAEECLLESIFGNGPVEKHTEIGHGFYYTKTPPKFDDYLMHHAWAFCTDEKTRALYQKWILGDTPAEEIFADYDDGCVGIAGDAGTGAVIAHILTVETHHPFVYCRKETKDGPDDSAIYTTDGVDQTHPRQRIDSELLRHIYEAVSELESDESFGKVYHQTEDLLPTDQVYNTKTFHYEFVDHKPDGE
jgi:hypothetical protein